MGTVHLMVFVPSVDRRGKRLRKDWTRPTLDAIGRLFRGATAYPRGLGVWRDDEAGGRLVYDKTTIVFSYIEPRLLTPAALAELRHFLHRMGREAEQGEIGLVVDGCYIGITAYEEA
jgi:hypothetical protein